jgi:hypothetical protein
MGGKWNWLRIMSKGGVQTSSSATISLATELVSVMFLKLKKIVWKYLLF